MPVTDFISNAEVSPNPATGKVTGDDNPASTQNGVITKLRDMGTDINTDLLALATIWDAHNHDPGLGSGPGGRPIGTGGVAAIGGGQVDNAAIGASQVTGGKTQNNAIATAKIADDTVEKGQIGLPKSVQKTGVSLTFNIVGASTFFVFHVEANEAVTVHDVTNTSIQVGTSGAGVAVTVRAYGCTDIT